MTALRAKFKCPLCPDNTPEMLNVHLSRHVRQGHQKPDYWRPVLKHYLEVPEEDPERAYSHIREAADSRMLRDLPGFTEANVREAFSEIRHLRENAFLNEAITVYRPRVSNQSTSAPQGSQGEWPLLAGPFVDRFTTKKSEERQRSQKGRSNWSNNLETLHGGSFSACNAAK